MKKFTATLAALVLAGAALTATATPAAAYRTSGPYGDWSCQNGISCGNVGLTSRSTTCINVTGRTSSFQLIRRTVCAGQTARGRGIYDATSFYVAAGRVVIGGPNNQAFAGPVTVYIGDVDRSNFTALWRG